jgi:hypothetical protein
MEQGRLTEEAMDIGTTFHPSTGSATERRRLADRRGFSWRTFIHGACSGRRRHPRRVDGGGLPYVDRFETGLFLTSIGVMTFCCLDAFLTLVLMGQGAREVNPFMEVMMRYDTEAFIWTKYALTALGIVFLLPLQKLRFLGRWEVKSLIHALFAGYACLVGYEWFLISLA